MYINDGFPKPYKTADLGMNSGRLAKSSGFARILKLSGVKTTARLVSPARTNPSIRQ